MFVVRHRRFFFILTGLLLVGSILATIIIPPKLSIEFTGGSLIEVAYENGRPELAVVRDRLHALELGEPSVRESGENAVTIRTRTLSPEERTQVLTALSNNGTETVTELRFNSIGPSLGNELAIKALYAIGIVTLAIMLYIAWAFRGVSHPVPSWGYGIIANPFSRTR